MIKLITKRDSMMLGRSYGVTESSAVFQLMHKLEKLEFGGVLVTFVLEI